MLHTYGAPHDGLACSAHHTGAHSSNKIDRSVLCTPVDSFFGTLWRGNRKKKKKTAAAKKKKKMSILM